MDDDSEISGFLDSFLGEGKAPRKPRVRHCTEQLRSGLALHVQAGQVERKKPSARRDVVFHKLLEDMANDLMEKGTCARASSREVSPRSPRTSPVREASPESESESVFRSSSPVPNDVDEDAPVKEDAQMEEEAEAEASEESEPEVDARRELQQESPQPHFRLQDFGGARSSKYISISVVLNTGESVLKGYGFERDSPMVDLFARVQEESSKEIQALIGPHGEKLERAELPLKWSGLKNGDVITLIQQKHPKLEDRMVNLAPSPQSSKTAKSPPVRTHGLSKAWKTMDFPDQGPVSMGGFADTIVGVTASRDSDISNAHAHSALPDNRSGLTAEEDLGGRDVAEDAELPSYWASMGMMNTNAETHSSEAVVSLKTNGKHMVEATRATQEEIVHIDNDTDANHNLPIPPEVSPEEFESLPGDAWTTPPHQNHNDESLETVEKGSMDVIPRKSPLPPRPSHNANSPIPSRATATPTKPMHDPVTSTPSRRSLGPPKMQRLDADSLKKRQEEMQKRSDAIWANIAASLEPAPASLGTKKLLKQR